MSQIFIPLICNGEKILSDVNLDMRGQVKSENSSLPVAIRDSKMRVLRLSVLNQTHGKMESICFI